jgi:hypothetical protein
MNRGCCGLRRGYSIVEVVEEVEKQVASDKRLELANCLYEVASGGGCWFPIS